MPHELIAYGGIPDPKSENCSGPVRLTSNRGKSEMRALCYRAGVSES